MAELILRRRRRGRLPARIPERAPVLPEEVHSVRIDLHADRLALGEPGHALHAGDEADSAVAAGRDAHVSLRLVAQVLEVLDDATHGAPVAAPAGTGGKDPGREPGGPGAAGAAAPEAGAGRPARGRT